MDQVSRATVPQMSDVSKTTHALVVIYHLFLGSVSAFTDFTWVKSSFKEDNAVFVLMLIGMSLIASVYFIAALGIWSWKSWGRTLSLALNWINVVGAVAVLTRLEFIKGLAGLLVSCLVLWWLSTSGVKFHFQSRSVVA